MSIQPNVNIKKGNENFTFWWKKWSKCIMEKYITLLKQITIQEEITISDTKNNLWGHLFITESMSIKSQNWYNPHGYMFWSDLFTL